MSADAAARLRIDKWLWHSRLFKSRTLAAKRVTTGGVRVNRKVIKKANHPVQPGDVLTFPLGPHVRVIEIVALGERRGPAVEARQLYVDLDPPLPRVRSDKTKSSAGAREPGSGRPTKKDRRAVERLQEPDGWD